MFNWTYFWINVLIGGATVFTGLLGVAVGLIFVIWTGFTFGFEWGAAAFIEQIIGFYGTGFLLAMFASK